MRTVTGRRYPRLIGSVRTALEGYSVPWVIENVEQARSWMDQPVTLCGVMFGLNVVRHRLFESNMILDSPNHVPHPRGTYSPTGHGDPNWREREANPHLKGKGYTQRCREAMGIDWMNRDELAQAIPPSYTEYVGRQLMACIDG